MRKIDDRKTVRGMGCLLCGKPGVDPHHYPIRKSGGAGFSMDEMVPLCRKHHDLFHRGDAQTEIDLKEASVYYLRMVKRWKESNA